MPWQSNFTVNQTGITTDISQSRECVYQLFYTVSAFYLVNPPLVHSANKTLTGDIVVAMRRAPFYSTKPVTHEERNTQVCADWEIFNVRSTTGLCVYTLNDQLHVQNRAQDVAVPS